MPKRIFRDKYSVGGGGKPHANPKKESAGSKESKSTALVLSGIEYERLPDRVNLKKIDFPKLNTEMSSLEGLFEDIVADVKKKQPSFANEKLKKYTLLASEFFRVFYDLSDFVTKQQRNLNTSRDLTEKQRTNIISLITNFDKLAYRFAKVRDTLSFVQSHPNLEDLKNYDPEKVYNSGNYLTIYKNHKETLNILDPKLPHEIQTQLIKSLWDLTKSKRDTLRKIDLPKFEVRSIKPDTPHGIHEIDPELYETEPIKIMEAITGGLGKFDEATREHGIDSLLNTLNNIELLMKHYKKDYLPDNLNKESKWIQDWAEAEQSGILANLDLKKRLITEFLYSFGIRQDRNGVWRRSGSYNINRVS